jgi:hypothetical protein
VGRPSFAELLAEKLREAIEPTTDTPSRTQGPMSVTLPHPLLFAVPYRAVTRVRCANYEKSCVTSGRQNFADFADRLLQDDLIARSNDDGQTTSQVSSWTSARTSRHLNSGESHALEILNRLGARLAPDFTHRDLRTAYRALARRLHPDCHQMSDPENQMRRARLFVVATKHHHTLLRVIARETQALGRQRLNH